MSGMVIEFEGEAWENFQWTIRQMDGFGVEIHMGDEAFDAILLAPTGDELDFADDGATIAFIRVVDDEYDPKLYPESAREFAVVDRIVVS